LQATGGASSDSATVTNTFQVAGDAGMTTVVATKQAAPGQTSVVLDLLPGAKDYYWRVQTTAAGAAIATSAIFKFTVAPRLVIQPPVPLQPLNGSLTHNRPTLVVADSNRIGTTGTLTYRFDVASDAGFTAMVGGGTVSEALNQTSFTLSSGLAPGLTYYWRAQATDTTSGTTSGYSTPQAFTALKPDDGTYRYDFTLHLVSAVDCAWDGVDSDFPVPCPQIADIHVDDGLVVTGDHVRYGPLPGFAGLELDMIRSGDHVSGTMTGEVFDGSLTLYISGVPSGITGSVDSVTGTFAGTYSGSFGRHSGGLGETVCHQSVFSFTLTPHP